MDSAVFASLMITLSLSLICNLFYILRDMARERRREERERNHKVAMAMKKKRGEQ